MPRAVRTPPRRSRTTAMLAATLAAAACCALSLTAASAQSGAASSAFNIDKLFQTGKQCPSRCTDGAAPCCMDGWCMTNAFGCLRSEGCIPELSRNGCTPVPMCKSFRADFNDAGELIDRTKYTEMDGVAKFWRHNDGTDNAVVEDGNLVLSLKWRDNPDNPSQSRGQGATIASLRFMQYGTISARIKAAPGIGVVSSFITKTVVSDTLGDEIDYEFVQDKPNEVQTNFYTNGELDWSKGARWYFPASSGKTTSSDYHIYTIDWSAERIVFKVDDETIRTVMAAGSDKYPRELMRVYLSVWDGGCNQKPDTVKWAGGETDWCKDPSKRDQVRSMYVDWIDVKCATEDPTPAKAYASLIAKPAAGSTGAAPSGGSSAGATPRTGSSGGSGSGNTGSVAGDPSAADSITGKMPAAVAAIAAGVAALAL